MAVLTVSQINRYISFKLKEDRNLQGIMVKGEVSNFTNHYRTGHWYFTLKDGESSIKAIMFASAASRVRFEIEDGMSVIVSGSVSVFERDGIYQLYVNDVQPDGAGAAFIAIEQLKLKLSKQGLFDETNKRQLPVLPQKIGIVTSKSGAALQDVINILSRRYPVGELHIFNAIVQGENAPDSICKGISDAEKVGCDVVIVGRGGGSIEDLSAFNNEKIAYAIYNCKVPIISAVGHETDFTIADLVADMRAPTPSAAAELVAPSIEKLNEDIEKLKKRTDFALKSTFDKKSEMLVSLQNRLSKFSPENRLKLSEEKFINLENRLNNAVSRKISKCEFELNAKIMSLENLSPVKVLNRGYSLIYCDNKLINSSQQIKVDDVDGSSCRGTGLCLRGNHEERNKVQACAFAGVAILLATRRNDCRATGCGPHGCRRRQDALQGDYKGRNAMQAHGTIRF